MVLYPAVSRVSINPEGSHHCSAETLVSWHRAGFRRYWRWKSNSRGGRPRIEVELRALIRQMSLENQLWGAPRIHGELLKLGLSVAQSTVAKYMVKQRGPPSQGWRTFLRNHAADIAAMDLFVVPTIGFKLLYGFVIVRIDRRDLVCINVTANPHGRMGLRTTSSAIATGSMAASSCADCAPWASATSLPRQPRLGRWLCRTANRIDPA